LEENTDSAKYIKPIISLGNTALKFAFGDVNYL